MGGKSRTHLSIAFNNSWLANERFRLCIKKRMGL